MKNILQFVPPHASSRQQSIFLAAALFLTCGSHHRAEREKREGTPLPYGTSNMMIPLPDEQQIDYLLSDMWAPGRLATSRSAQGLADDVSIVNGSWAPPLSAGPTTWLSTSSSARACSRCGWTAEYVHQVSGTVGWACYQWDFAAIVMAQPSASQGQTTVVLEKRNNRWVIVHNHTSLATAPPPATPPAKPRTRLQTSSTLTLPGMWGFPQGLEFFSPL